MAVAPQWKIKIGSANYPRSVNSAFAIKEIHIAMLATLADFMATMPGIPNYHLPFKMFARLPASTRFAQTLIYKVNKVEVHRTCFCVFIFLGKEHKSAFFIEGNSCSISINGDESAGATTHCGKHVFYL